MCGPRRSVWSVVLVAWVQHLLISRQALLKMWMNFGICDWDLPGPMLCSCLGSRPHPAAACAKFQHPWTADCLEPEGHSGTPAEMYPLQKGPPSELALSYSAPRPGPKLS